MKRIIKENIQDIPSFIKRRIDEYVRHTMNIYDDYNMRGNFKNLIDEIGIISIVLVIV